MRTRFLRVDRSVAVRVSTFEDHFDVIEVFVLGQSLVVVRISDRPILLQNAAPKLGAIERAIVIMVALVENLAGRAFASSRLIVPSLSVSIPLNTDAASEGESDDVKPNASSKVLRLINLTTMPSVRSLARLFCALQRDPQAAVDGEGLRRPEARWIGQEGRRVGQRGSVEQSAAV